MARHHWVSIGLVAGVVLATVPLLVVGGNWSSVLAQTLLDFGHVPLFGLIATLCLVLADHRFGDRSVATQYIGAFAGALIVGVATELAQMFGKRDADLWDLARNAAGAALALVWWATFDRRLDATAIRRRGSRIALCAVGIVVTLALLTPILGAVRAYRERDDRFPVLFSFETSSQARFMRTRLAWYELAPPPDAWSVDAPKRVAHISFLALTGCAIVFNEPYPDWTGQEALILEVFLPGERKIRLGLRIDDGKNTMLFKDRFNRSVVLEPGLNRLRISMAEIVAGPEERELDISSIDRIVIFPIGVEDRCEIYLGPVVLETAETATSSTSPG